MIKSRSVRPGTQARGVSDGDVVKATRTRLPPPLRFGFLTLWQLVEWWLKCLPRFYFRENLAISSQTCILELSAQVSFDKNRSPNQGGGLRFFGRQISRRCSFYADESVEKSIVIALREKYSVVSIEKL